MYRGVVFSSVAIAMLLPVTALGQTTGGAQTDIAPASHTQPPISAEESGWGLRATMQGRSIDLDALALGWTDDRVENPRSVEAGYDWRGAAADTVIGYADFDSGPDDNPATRRAAQFRSGSDPGGVLGLSFVLHPR